MSYERRSFLKAPTYRFHLQFLFPTHRPKLDEIEIQSVKTAHFLCRLIPSQGPFERFFCRSSLLEHLLSRDQTTPDQAVRTYYCSSSRYL